METKIKQKKSEAKNTITVQVDVGDECYIAERDIAPDACPKAVIIELTESVSEMITHHGAVTDAKH